MAKADLMLSRAQVRRFVLYFFFNYGKFPPDTTNANWESKKMSEMQWDDPPLPGDPHFEKKKLAQLLVYQFNNMGLTLPSPLEIMKDDSKTMKDLWTFCFDNQGERKAIK